VTAKTESVQYDHPNHTVTVTTISDLDLSGARLLGLPLPEVGPRTDLGKQGLGVGGFVRAAQCWFISRVSYGKCAPGSFRTWLSSSVS
jgi:hypothetical protein